MDIELTWWRDARGYRLAEPAPPESIPTMWPSLDQQFPIKLPESFDAPQPPDLYDQQYIVGKGGTLVPYRADEDLNRILFELANSPPDAEGALRCFEQYLRSGGALREDVMLGRALSLRRLGRTGDETRAWEDLVAQYPRSVHAERARRRLLDLGRP